MATLKQIEANRLNARKSTGPRTAAGKAASRMNALKTGIDAASETIRGEDPKVLAALTAEYYDRFHPATPEQRTLVDTLISADWLLRRLRRAEAQVWEQAFERLDRWESETEAPLGEAFHSTDRTFSRLQRRIDSAERNYHRALKELQRQPPQPKIGFIPQASPNDSSAPPRLCVKETPAPEIGFVPQASPTTPECQPTPDSAPTHGGAGELNLYVRSDDSARCGYLPSRSSIRC